MNLHEEKQQLILQILRTSTRPLLSRELAERLDASGHEMSDRTVRLYLTQLHRRGLIDRQGRRGASITGKGSAVARTAQASRRVGFLSARIDEMTSHVDFSLSKRCGHIVVNLSIVRPEVLLEHLDDVELVFAKGYAMGTRVGFLGEGEALGDTVIPEGFVGFCTVCSITINGILLARGVPTRSRFGGLLAIEKNEPDRFEELIEYDGTSIDPLEVFIRSGMTDYLGTIHTGSGRVGASFREYPASSRDLMLEIADLLVKNELAGVVKVGFPGCSLLGVQVSEGRYGAIVMGGLNPIAILEERDIRVDSRALHGLMPYENLIPYTELRGELERRI